MRWPVLLATLSVACDPLLSDPQLPEPVAAWLAPTDAELRGRATPIAVRGEVASCRQISELTWTVDDRPMRVPLEATGARWRGEVPVAALVEAVGFAALALPDERPGRWRAQATCDDFGRRVETAPRAVFVSPFEALAVVGETVDDLLVSGFGAGRPAIFAVTSGDLAQMDARRGCADDVPAEAELSSCWQSWTARPSGVGPMHRLDGRIALGVRCSDFDGGRLCPPGFAKGLVFVDEKFDAALSIPEPEGCALETVQVGPQRLYVLSVCDEGASTEVEPIDVVDGVGGPRITRQAPVELPGRVFTPPATRAPGEVLRYGRLGDGRVEAWSFTSAGIERTATEVRVVDDVEFAAAGTDGVLLVTVRTAAGVEVRRFRPDRAEPVAAWSFARPDVYGQMFGAEPWARSPDALWSLADGAPPLAVELGEGTRWQLMAADPGVFAVLGGLAARAGPARVVHAAPSGAVRTVLPELGLDMRARLRRAGDRVYGALGAYVFTISASRTSPPSP